jgi:hypothetical protein
MLFRVKSEDGKGMDISSKCNKVSRMANIKQKEDSVLLHKKGGLYDDSSWK